jgi:phosphorylase kinase alpha/beta subunit
VTASGPSPGAAAPPSFHNRELAALVPGGRYSAPALSRVERALDERGTLEFSRLPSGLFAASSAGRSIAGSGYSNVWVRDNVYVAFAHQVCGRTEVAAGVARALLAFFGRHRHRFEDIIADPRKAQTVSLRPHVRFDGERLQEISTESWPHAQNDALGYFLWLYASLARSGHVATDESALDVLALFPRYFQAIRYWQDEDSGHWEETRKISASSIGTVVAGLEALAALARDRTDLARTRAFGAGIVETIADLIARGRAALDDILPQECAQRSIDQNRRYDAALLFLLFPLAVVTEPAMVGLILHDVDRFLTGECGIRRYLGDSYWAPDYETRLPPEDRTRDFTTGTDLRERDTLLERIGDEAQWCLFDPMLSAFYGARHAVSRSASDLDRQALHFTRALSQISPAWRCPELYYLRQGRYVENPHTPLQWTQANLLVATHWMRTSTGGTP